MGGDKDHGAEVFRSDDFGGLDAIHRSLQDNVHKDNIGAEGQTVRDCVFSGSYRPDRLVAELLESLTDLRGCDDVVLDNKYPFVCHCALLNTKYYRQN